MQENRTAPAGNAGPCVVVDLDDEIIEMILARQPVAAIARRACHGAVIMPVDGVFGPGIRGPDDSDRQGCPRPGITVGPPPQPDRAKGATGRAAVTFEFIGLDSAAPKRDR